jgi:hypothetical protein
MVAIEEEFRRNGGCAETGRYWKSGKERRDEQHRQARRYTAPTQPAWNQNVIG